MRIPAPAVIIPLLFALVSGCRTGVPPEEVALVYFNLGNAYADQDKQSDAVTAYSKALYYDPGLFSAGYNLCRIYLDMKKYEEADDILNRLLEKDPENTILLETLGWSCYLQGKRDQALEIYEQILARIPRHSHALYNAGILYMETGDTGRAYELFSIMYKETPEDPKVLVRLGVLERERGNLEAASVTMEKCVELEEDNRESLEILGDIYAGLARYGDAVAVYVRAAEIESSPDLIFKRAFILLTAVEDFDEGMKALQEAVEAGFSDGDRINELVDYPELYRRSDILTVLEEKKLYSPPEEIPLDEEAPESGEGDIR